jgi:hypothetical protein
MEARHGGRAGGAGIAKTIRKCLGGIDNGVKANLLYLFPTFVDKELRDARAYKIGSVRAWIIRQMEHLLGELRCHIRERFVAISSAYLGLLVGCVVPDERAIDAAQYVDVTRYA